MTLVLSHAQVFNALQIVLQIADVLRGRGSKQIRVQDQHCMSVSPNDSNLTENGEETLKQYLPLAHKKK